MPAKRKESRLPLWLHNSANTMKTGVRATRAMVSLLGRFQREEEDVLFKIFLLKSFSIA